MKLFRHFEKQDPKKIYEAVKAGYGVEHPERISGFYGAFTIPSKDVYVSDEVAERLLRDPDTREYVKGSVKRFLRDDYGFVTEWEEGAYIEDRYIGGDTSWLVGRYSKPHQRCLIVADLCDILYVSFVEEDASGIYEEHYRNSRYYREGETVESRMINEIRYVKVRD